MTDKLDGDVRVLKVQPGADPRSYKLARALMNHTGVAVAQAVYSVQQYDQFSNTYLADNVRFGPSAFRSNGASRIAGWATSQLGLMSWPLNRIVSSKIRYLARNVDANIIHTNGAPDALGAIAKEDGDIPVVHEIYDTYSLYDSARESFPRVAHLRDGLLLPYEMGFRRLNLRWEHMVHKLCDALVFTSEEMRQNSRELYGEFRSVVVPNGVLKENLPRTFRSKLALQDGLIHCVYLGSMGRALSHRNIVPQIRQVVSDKRIVLHLYPTSMSRADSANLVETLSTLDNVVLHEPLHYSSLYETITQYDLGLVLLNPSDENLLRVALPNKIFEYVGCGLPVAVPPYKSLTNFVSKFQCGFVVTDWSHDIVANLSSLRRVPFREEFTIDFHVKPLVDLYHSLI